MKEYESKELARLLNFCTRTSLHASTKLLAMLLPVLLVTTGAQAQSVVAGFDFPAQRYLPASSVQASGPTVRPGGLGTFDGGTWSVTGSLATPRYSHTATLLPGGKVLVAGGFSNSFPPLASVELYDPASGTWTTTGSLVASRTSHTAVLLLNGKVLVAGGEGADGNPVATAELYDPGTGIWSATGSFADARIDHTMTLLPNGKVLIAGGRYDSFSVFRSAQLYDPASGTWSATGSLAVGRIGHTATLLPNGKVLVAGGYDFDAGLLASAELYDPASGTWTSTGSLIAGRSDHTATLLPNGKVLIAGGDISAGGSELYDPASGTWSVSGSLNVSRIYHAAVLLPSGEVLVAGGFGNGAALDSVELYEPGDGTWSATGNLALGRYTHTLTVLPNGIVLIAGGIDRNNGPFADPLARADLYTPAALTPGTLGNISTRLRVETGDNVLIGGFIITGTQPKKIIVRASGPSLSSFFPGALADPVLELRNSSGGLIGSNDNWRSDQEVDIIATGIPPSNDLESAIVATLPANNSAYTAIVRGVNNGTGIGVVEAYDLDRTVDSKLGNISTRGFVQTGDNVLIAGTIVLGEASQQVLIRAIGPSLNLAGEMADPTLELRDGNGGLIRSNDNWRSDQEAEITATGIPPSDDLESAIVQTLPANGASYTAIVRGVDGTTGIAVVEVYALN
jgi:N-acetylneuraminic acid mutarotase